MRYLLPLLVLLAVGCSPAGRLQRSGERFILSQSFLQSAHTGLAVYDPASGRYLYRYQSDKSFIPASNTKIFTCYAAMRYLGDSLPGVRLGWLSDSVLYLEATGDPSFLHPDIKTQRLWALLNQPAIKEVQLYANLRTRPLGSGWSWNDYQETYMAERSAFPLFGNIATVRWTGTGWHSVPALLSAYIEGRPEAGKGWRMERPVGSNQLKVLQGSSRADQKNISFTLESPAMLAAMLRDTLRKRVVVLNEPVKAALRPYASIPTDSLLKIMMHRSDNFFAEQSLLMVSDRLLGYLSDQAVIDTLQKTILANLPQPVRWIDGSGLSRYNLMSPESIVTVLDRMQRELPWERITAVFPTGGTGTLGNYFKQAAGRMYAKTGTLSNNIALSGYLLTRKGRRLIFSTMINNHQANTTDIRRATEAFLLHIIDRY